MVRVNPREGGGSGGSHRDRRRVDAGPINRKPKGFRIPDGLGLYDELPEDVSEDAASVGESDEASPGDHVHRFEHDHDDEYPPTPHDSSHHSVAYAPTPHDSSHHSVAYAPVPHGNAHHSVAYAPAPHGNAHHSVAYLAESEVSESAFPSTVARRDASGRLAVAEATSSGHAINMALGDNRYLQRAGGILFGAVLSTHNNGLTAPSFDIPNGIVNANRVVATDILYGMGSTVGVAVNGVSALGTGLLADPKGGSLDVERVGVGYRPVRASAFTVSSDRRRKVDVETADVDALAAVRRTPVRQYRRREPRMVAPHGPNAPGAPPRDEVPTGEVVDGPPEIGLVADEAPPELLSLMGRDHDEVGVDLYAMCSVLWRAVQQQQEQIDALTARIDVLESQ